MQYKLKEWKFKIIMTWAWITDKYSGGICDNCKRRRMIATHKCGSFCDDCDPGDIIDISPLTLSKLLPSYDRIIPLISEKPWKCPRCLEGLSPEEWQLREAKKFEENYLKPQRSPKNRSILREKRDELAKLVAREREEIAQAGRE
jgi:hypothetical protein